MEDTDKYDIFFSYERSSSKIVIDLYYKLLCFDWKMLIERYLSIYVSESKKDISESRIFLCFFTRQYRDSNTCIEKLKYALKSNKKILLIMLDNISLDCLPQPVQESIKVLNKLIAYNQLYTYDKWSDDLFCELCDRIDILLNPVLSQNQVDNSDMDDSSGDVVSKLSKYDVYCSYHVNDLDTVGCICNRLRDYQVTMWFDSTRSESNNANRLHHDVQNAIVDAEIFLCFVSENYFNSYYSQMEIKFAKRRAKKCIYVMLDNLNFSKSGYIALLISGSLRFNGYDDTSWPENQIQRLFAAIYTVYTSLNSALDSKTKLNYSPEVLNFYRILKEITLEAKRLFEKLNGLRAANPRPLILNENEKSKFVEIVKHLEVNVQEITKQKAHMHELISNLNENEQNTSQLIQEHLVQITNKNLNPAERQDLEKSVKKALHLNKAFIEQLKFVNKEALIFLDLEASCLTEINDVAKALRTTGNNRDVDMKNKVLFEARLKHFDEYKSLLNKEDSANNMIRRINIFEKYGVMLNVEARKNSQQES